MRIINNDEILQHSGITETDLMNYYGLSKAQYDDYIAHFGIKGMLWGFANGIRQAGKRVAQGLDYDYQNNKYNKSVSEAQNDVREAKKNLDLQKQRYEQNASVGLNRYVGSKTLSSNVNTAAINYGKTLTNLSNAQKKQQEYQTQFQNSTYGKTLYGIKQARTTINTAISTVKSSNAYKKGTALAGKIVNKIGSIASSALSAAKSRGLQIYARLFGTKYSQPIGPTRTIPQALSQSIKSKIAALSSNKYINKASSALPTVKNIVGKTWPIIKNTAVDGIRLRNGIK